MPAVRAALPSFTARVEAASLIRWIEDAKTQTMRETQIARAALRGLIAGEMEIDREMRRRGTFGACLLV